MGATTHMPSPIYSGSLSITAPIASRLRDLYLSTTFLPHYQDSFEVKLIGGSAPNAGRVEVKYDDTWSNVCYKTQRFFRTVQVVCKELGFPGALFKRQGGYGDGTREFSMQYECFAGIV